MQATLNEYCVCLVPRLNHLLQCSALARDEARVLGGTCNVLGVSIEIKIRASVALQIIELICCNTRPVHALRSIYHGYPGSEAVPVITYLLRPKSLLTIILL